MAIPTLRKAYLDTAAGQLHVRRMGAGRPILLLHQSPSSGAMWDPVMPHLARAGFDAVALDMPGHGESYRPASPPSIDDYAASTLATLDALGWEQCDLLGHHTGALVAARFAGAHPSRVRRLALWALAIYVDALRASRERNRNEPVPDYDDEGAALVDFWRRQRQLAGAGYTQALGVRAMIEMLQTGNARPWGHWAGQRCDREAIIRAVRQPTLVMGGERDPLWAGVEAAARLFPDGRFEVMPGGGLYVTDEAPEDFTRRVVRFLAA